MAFRTSLIISFILGFNLISLAQTPPVLNPIGSQTVADGSMLFFKAAATYENPDDLTYSISDPLPGMDIFPEHGLFSWIPDNSQIGAHDITIEVTDGMDSDDEVITIIVTEAVSSGAVIYVNQYATGSNNGTSWDNAYVELTAALDNDKDGDQIWVTSGTYTPLATGERTESFVINKNTVIYGGFLGGEPSRSDRDVLLNPTILSGDRSRDDETVGTAENSYHVVWMQTTDRGAAIDGVTITAGHGDGDASYNAGSGIISFVGNSALHVKNTTFENNVSNYHGVSSILDFGSSVDPSRLIVSNSIFRNNTSSGNVIAVNANDVTRPFTRVDILHSNITSNDALVIDSQRESIVTRFYNSLILDQGEDYIRALYGAKNEFYNCAFDNDPEDMFSTGITVFEGNLIDQTIDLASDHQFIRSSPLKDAGNDSYSNLLGANAKDIAGNSRIMDSSCDIGATEFTNYAPVAITNFDLSLENINEDVTESDGMSVSSLIQSHGGIISDRNYQPSSGVAITGVDDTNGSWQYSINSGVDWLPVGSVENESALLLSNSTDAKIRFIPNANFNGTLAEGLTFRAWDQFTGTPNERTDVSTSGNFTAFSTNTETISITVLPINDAPTLALEDQTAEEGVNFAIEIMANNVDDDELTYSLDATSTNTGMGLTSGGNFSWKPTTSDIGSHLVTVSVSDGEFTIESTFTISVTGSTARKQTVTGLEDESLPAIQIYPNPTTNYIEISPSVGESTYNISLYSLTGQLIYQDLWETKNGKHHLDLSSQHSGIYVLNLQSNTTTITQRIIKQ